MKIVGKMYTFDDLALIPKYNTVKSRLDVSLKTRLTKNTTIDIPIVAANMDTVISDSLADVLISYGTYPIFHRFTTYENITRWAEKYGNKCFLSCGLKQYEICEIADKYNCRGVVIDIANGHCEEMIEMIKLIKYKYNRLDVIAGNVCTYEGCKDLMEAGADGVKVGIGPGSCCITRIMTGFGTPQMSAIFECAKASKEYGVPIIADGGIEIPKHLVMSLAGGASCVMIGKLFASTEESASLKHFVLDSSNKNVRMVKYRGQASKDFQTEFKGEMRKGIVEEGVTINIECIGKAEDLIDKFCGGLRSGCTYAGAYNLEELETNALFAEVTNNYITESSYREKNFFK